MGCSYKKGRLLVLGGTGFVGSEIAKRGVETGYEVVSVSRRGLPPGGLPQGSLLERVDWRAGDLVENPETIREILSEGGFVGVVHAVGMLLASDLNAMASGSGSVPSPGATYDAVTRATAFSAIDAAADCVEGAASSSGGDGDGKPAVPFVFVSAAEARWDFRAPVDWLEEYLVAKRAVERRLGEMTAAGRLRGSCLRPSLVYTFDRPQALPAVAAFVVGNAIGIPFVDRPVTVDTLATAAVQAVEDPTVSGILDFREMERLAANAALYV